MTTTTLAGYTIPEAVYGYADEDSEEYAAFMVSNWED